MAKTNKDAAFGLRAIGKVGQNRDNQGLGEYSISSGDTTQIFFQDAVSATAAGTIHQAAASEAFLLGSLNGVFYTDPTTTKPTFANNYPGSIAASDIKAFVADDPYERFDNSIEQSYCARADRCVQEFQHRSNSWRFCE